MKFTKINKPPHGAIAKQAQGTLGYERLLGPTRAYWQSQKAEGMSAGTAEGALDAEEANLFIESLDKLIDFRDVYSGVKNPNARPRVTQLYDGYRRELLGVLALSKFATYLLRETPASPSPEDREKGIGILLEFPSITIENTSDARVHLPGDWADSWIGPTTGESTWYRSRDNSLYLRRFRECHPEPMFIESVMTQFPGQRIALDALHTVVPYLPSR